MGDKKRNRARRNAAAVITSAALTLGCWPASSVIDPDETTGSISGASQPAPKTISMPKVACPGMDIRPAASTLSIAAEEADETAFWIEFSVEEGMLNEQRVAPLLTEAHELTSIFVSSRKTARNRTREFNHQ